MRIAVCKSRVDFPIPGSPETKTIEPGTTPPPKTLSNSSYPVENLLICPLVTSESFINASVYFDSLTLFPSSSSSMAVSTSEFHSPHSGHLPTNDRLFLYHRHKRKSPDGSIN